MDIKLTKAPQNVRIIEGFPGFGLVATIACEFLTEHFDVQLIGKLWSDELPATVAIHQNKLINPISIYYNKKHNIVILHSITAVPGYEWKIADAILEIAKKCKAKEIISLEGVGSTEATEETRTFYYTNDQKKGKELEKFGMKNLKEGIIMGVTSSLLVKSDIPLTCFFAETHSTLPDSKAAAKLLEKLGKYLNLGVDTKPLIESAAKFEEKLRGLLQKSQDAMMEQERKKLSYVG